MRPLVSVIFPCYNAGKFLNFSLESILNQDYNNLEIICINDGSTDNTLALLEDYKKADTRITIVNNISNLGLIASLNNALSMVTGEFFARMDADDYCEPDRISRQVTFITKHPTCDVVSTGYHYFIHNNRKFEYVPPVGYSPNALRFISLFSTPLNHGASLSRAKVIKSGLYYYDRNFPHSEDFELFSRLAWQGVALSNIPQGLYWVRVNPESVSNLYNDEQIRSHLKITKRNLEKNLGVSEPLKDTILKTLCNRINTPISFTELKTAINFLDKCYKLSNERFSYSTDDQKEIKKYLNMHKLNIIIQSNKARFLSKEAFNSSFFLRSLSLLRTEYTRQIIEKLLNYGRYRVF